MEFFEEKLKFVEEMLKLTDKYMVEELETSEVRIKKTLFYNVDDNYIPQSNIMEEDEESLLFNATT